MSISIQCPDCDKKLKAKDELAGRRVKCPGCGRLISVPTTAPIAAGEPRSRSAKKSPPPRAPGKSEEDVASSPRPRKSRVRWLLFAGGAVSLCAAGVCIVAVLLVSFAMPRGANGTNPVNNEGRPGTDDLGAAFVALEANGLLAKDIKASAVTASIKEMAKSGCERVALPVSLVGPQKANVPDWRIGYVTNQAMMSNLMDAYARNALVRKKSWPVFRETSISTEDFKKAMGEPKSTADVKGWAIRSMDTGQIIQPAPNYTRLEYGPMSVVASNDAGKLVPLELQIDLQRLPDFRKGLEEKVVGSWTIDTEAYTADIKSSELTDKYTADKRDELLAKAPKATFTVKLHSDGRGDISWSGFTFLNKQEGQATGKWKDTERRPEGAGVSFQGNAVKGPPFVWPFLPDGNHLVFKVDFDEPAIRLKRMP